jgi:DNA-directed RNA polymerase specialized sigma24 family protein
MTTLTPSQTTPSTPTEDPVLPDASVLAEAHTLALRVARAELGQQAHDGIDADDVAQEVLLRFAALDLAGIGTWRAWAPPAARNRARDALRAQRRHRHEDLAGYGPTGDAAEGAGLPRQLRVLGPSGGVLAAMAWARATQLLNERERQALAASLDGASNQEIAEQLGYASAASVAVTLTRARVKLRAAFPAGPARDLLLGEIRLY